MRPRRARTWLWLLLAAVGVSPVAAQDPVEYLLEGKDQKRGIFQGRLEVRPGPAGVAVTRRATFRAGPEVLSGTGSRQGDELRVEFPAGPGLSGAVIGGQAPKPIRCRTRFKDADAELASTLRQGDAAYARDTGQRVEAPFGTGAPDPAKRPTPESASHTYKRIVGVPFIRGEGDAHEVDINDIKQGGLGDCYFMAGLAAVALSQPERIRNMIEDHGDGTFSVYAWRHSDQWEDDPAEVTRTAVRIRLDDQFPSGGFGPAYAEYGDTETVGGETRHELWPMLFEKAWAQTKGSYAAIEGGWASQPMSFFGAEDVEDETPADLSPGALEALLKKAAAEGRPMSFGVPTTNSALGIHGEHYYTFWGFDEQGRVRLYNPWGSSHPPRGLTIEELQKFTDTLHVGPP